MLLNWVPLRLVVYKTWFYLLINEAQTEIKRGASKIGPNFSFP